MGRWRVQAGSWGCRRVQVGARQGAGRVWCWRTRKRLATRIPWGAKAGSTRATHATTVPTWPEATISPWDLTSARRPSGGSRVASAIPGSEREDRSASWLPYAMLGSCEGSRLARMRMLEPPRLEEEGPGATTLGPWDSGFLKALIGWNWKAPLIWEHGERKKEEPCERGAALRTLEAGRGRGKAEGAME